MKLRFNDAVVVHGLSEPGTVEVEVHHFDLAGVCECADVVDLNSDSSWQFVHFEIK